MRNEELKTIPNSEFLIPNLTYSEFRIIRRDNMEDFIINNLGSITSEAALILTWFGTVLYVAPKVVQYIRDESDKNQKSIMSMIEDARVERSEFYRQLGIMNERLINIENKIENVHDSVNNLT